ncbi:MAG: hypothetical protein LUG12_12990 [Erysipelotrichaceae bacterium]|nr:hypothetical protein [Erysipelotrichaceae bacterium]
MLTFITKVMKNQKQKFLMLLLVSIILLSFEMCFLAIYDSYDTMHMRNTIDFLPLMRTITFIGIFICIVLIVFVTNYFINSQKQEFSILLLVGQSSIRLFEYMMVQFGGLLLIGWIISIPIGLLFMNVLLSSFNYNLLRIIAYHALFLLCTIVIILAIGSSQFNDLSNALAQYLNHKEVTKYQIKLSSIVGNKKYPIGSFIFLVILIIITIACLIQFIQAPSINMNTIIYCIIMILGLGLITARGINFIYDCFHKQLLNHPILMNGLSKFMDLSKILLMLIEMNSCMMPLIAILILLSTYEPLISEIILPTFFMFTTMIGLCYILRFSIYINNTHTSVATMNAIGYDQNKQRKINSIKDMIFFILCIVIPSIIIGIMMNKLYIMNLISYQTVIYSLLVYIIINISVLIYMIINENQHLKEVTSHVKYLNRGE